MDEVTPAQLMRPSIGQINTSCTVGGLIYITSRLTLFPGPLHLGLPVFRDVVHWFTKLKRSKPGWWEALHGIEAVCPL